MKTRALHISLSALMVLSAFFFTANLCQAAQKERGVIQPVTISTASGNVEVLPKGKTVWKRAKPGVKLSEGDKIRTDVAALAELIFEDGSIIKMKEETILEVKTARKKRKQKATEYYLDMRMGEIMLELQKLKKGSSFEVETPTAVAAVRGTTYYIRTGTKMVGGQEKSYVEIYIDSDDIVQFTNILSGQSYLVGQGQSAIIFDDGTGIEPYPIPPDEQEKWKSGFDTVYDSKKGMRDVDEEEGEDSGDLDEDVDETTDEQNDSQNEANQDQVSEQEISGIAKINILTDSDGDGVPDYLDLFPTDPNRASGNDADGDGIDDEFDPNDNDGPLGDLDGDGYINSADAFPNDFWEHIDTDSDSVGDFEDAFPEDSTIHPDTILNDIYGNLVTVAGYGSRDELRQAAIDNLLAIQGLRNDISEMLNDIQTRQFEAVKESIFDHQAGKVMVDHWGNRVRVEEYVSKPTNDQVQILALNLRTAGPNAGISSLDFRVKFADGTDLSGTNLRDLPWDDYMDNPLVSEFPEGYVNAPYNYDESAQLIFYNNGSEYYDPTAVTADGYPIPERFSLEAKNPYSEAVEFVEDYSGLEQASSPIFGRSPIWYQVQQNNNISINGIEVLAQDYSQSEQEGATALWNETWGDGWNQENRFTFLANFDDSAWLIGAFYLIENDGSSVESVNEDYLDGEILNIRGIRDCINPEYNLEMVFFSSEFDDTPFDLPDTIASDMDDKSEAEREAYLLNVYNNSRTVDVITIPEIATPYYTPD